MVLFIVLHRENYITAQSKNTFIKCCGSGSGQIRNFFPGSRSSKNKSADKYFQPVLGLKILDCRTVVGKIKWQLVGNSSFCLILRSFCSNFQICLNKMGRICGSGSQKIWRINHSGSTTLLLDVRVGVQHRLIIIIEQDTNRQLADSSSVKLNLTDPCRTVLCQYCC